MISATIPALVDDVVEYEIFPLLVPETLHSLRTVSKCWNECLTKQLYIPFTSEELQFYSGSDQSHIAYRKMQIEGYTRGMVIVLRADAEAHYLSFPYVVLGNMWSEGKEYFEGN
jgi:hypothetical protein